jgi:hypothetical protein
MSSMLVQLEAKWMCVSRCATKVTRVVPVHRPQLSGNTLDNSVSCCAAESDHLAGLHP